MAPKHLQRTKGECRLNEAKTSNRGARDRKSARGKQSDQKKRKGEENRGKETKIDKSEQFLNSNGIMMCPIYLANLMQEPWFAFHAQNHQ